jgi:hypothetical protein
MVKKYIYINISLVLETITCTVLVISMIIIDIAVLKEYTSNILWIKSALSTENNTKGYAQQRNTLRHISKEEELLFISTCTKEDIRRKNITKCIYKTRQLSCLWVEYHDYKNVNVQILRYIPLKVSTWIPVLVNFPTKQEKFQKEKQNNIIIFCNISQSSFFKQLYC